MAPRADRGADGASPMDLLSRIVVAVDPPAARRRQIFLLRAVVASRPRSGRPRGGAGRRLGRGGASPTHWAQASCALRRFDADCVVAEINQGGDMVTSVLRNGRARRCRCGQVRATRAKWLRAEPVAALYEQGRVIHAGHFASLGDQMFDFGPDGLSSGRSPDRLTRWSGR